ncbi:hypothetical protein I4F81_012577 [Pyropia yezoensis]|uniref:Uncharacterized protein n=1 Tax=Pyropia yezoensis TaxID=2788 RepID=A0ACC3CJ30_PYRYE|nr:hypothetical protein I4F81_012577 [Neopyropia yezoensis]
MSRVGNARRGWAAAVGAAPSPMRAARRAKTRPDGPAPLFCATSPLLPCSARLLRLITPGPSRHDSRPGSSPTHWLWQPPCRTKATSVVRAAFAALVPVRRLWNSPTLFAGFMAPSSSPFGTTMSLSSSQLSGMGGLPGGPLGGPPRAPPEAASAASPLYFSMTLSTFQLFTQVSALSLWCRPSTCSRCPCIAW